MDAINGHHEKKQLWTPLMLSLMMNAINGRH